MSDKQQLEHFITLCVGDWSGDGHEKTVETVIKSNLNSEELQAAYDSGVGIIGFDLKDFYTDSYDTPSLTPECVDSLVKHKYPLIFDKYEENPDTYTKRIWDSSNRYYIEEIYVNEYICLYLFIALLGNSDSRFEYLKTEGVDIGGYGLFMY